MGDHECINALAARNALRGGSWLIPEIGDAPLIRKMPLGVWAIGGSSALLGVVSDAAREVTAFTARLPSGLAGVATVLVVYWLGTMMYGRGGGLAAGVICAASPGVMFFARNAQVDMLLGFFCALALACLYRAIHGATHQRLYLFLAYGAFGTAMLAKAPLPLTMVGLPAAVYWVAVMPLLREKSGGMMAARIPDGAGSRGDRQGWTRGAVRQLRSIFRLWSWPGMALFVVLVGAWPAYIYAKVENALPLWRIEYLDRFSGELGGKEQPWWYYLPLALGFTAPFLLSLPEGVAAAFLKTYRERRDGLLFALTWAGVGTLFVSLAAFKRPHYLLPVFPAYCLLVAPVIERLFLSPFDVKRAVVRAACLSVPLLLAGAIIGGAYALRKENAEFLDGYRGACIAAWVVWTAAAAAFATGRRGAALWLTALALPAGGGVFWEISGKQLDLNPAARALEIGFKPYGPLNDDVYWLEGQPKWSAGFYGGLELKRMVSEVEAASMRRGRAKVTPELIKFTEERVSEKIASGKKFYLVVSEELVNMLLRKSDRLKIAFGTSQYSSGRGNQLVVLAANE